MSRKASAGGQELPGDGMWIPPHSIEAESSVLGGLLLENSTFDTVADILVPQDFYSYDHRLIYEAACQLLNAGRPVDVVTLYEHLKERGRHEEVGGLAYLNSLAQYVPSASNTRRYAELVRDHSVKRRLIATGEEIAGLGRRAEGRQVDELVDQAEQKVFAIAEERANHRKGFKSMDTLVVRLLDRVQELADNPQEITGVPTGFIDLDRMTAGLQPGDLIVLAARPSMGKTSFAINIAENVALNSGLPVAVFSMEMGADQLAVRIVGSIGRINQQNLRRGTLSDEEWGRLPDAVERLRSVDFHIDDSSDLTPSTLRANARRLARQCGKLGLVVLDYLQLMGGSSADGDGRGNENRATELGEISRALKALAKELGCPVIALSQLNRGVEQRPDKRPIMSDLRESGAIEQDADLIWFLYRDEYYTKEACKEPGVAELIIAKHRNGPTGTVKLAFLKQLTRFESMAYGGGDF